MFIIRVSEQPHGCLSSDWAPPPNTPQKCCKFENRPWNFRDHDNRANFEIVFKNFHHLWYRLIWWLSTIDLILNRPLIAHLSLYTRLKPTCDKKIGITGLVYIINQLSISPQSQGSEVQTPVPPSFLNILFIFNP